MRRIVLNIMLIVLIFSSAGCVTLSRFDQERLYELKSIGISETEVHKKNPGVAGVLNILPGFGNFYLAIGTNESEQWTYGFLNLITWPWSMVWGIPGGAIDASTINKKETVFYYTYSRHGRAELQKRMMELNVSNTTLSDVSIK